MDDYIKALEPVISRVRTDKTAVKKSGGVFWTKEALTDENLKLHLSGVAARGVCPIKEGEDTTQLTLLDLDSHKGETSWNDMAYAALSIIDALETNALYANPWRSSGGNGMHLIILWDEPQDAYSVRKLLNEILKSVGYKNGTKGVAAKQVEIFPKQDSVSIGGSGNQFILPLACCPHDFHPLSFWWL